MAGKGKGKKKQKELAAKRRKRRKKKTGTDLTTDILNEECRIQNAELKFRARGRVVMEWLDESPDATHPAYD